AGYQQLTTGPACWFEKRSRTTTRNRDSLNELSIPTDLMQAIDVEELSYLQCDVLQRECGFQPPETSAPQAIAVGLPGCKWLNAVQPQAFGQTLVNSSGRRIERRVRAVNRDPGRN